MIISILCTILCILAATTIESHYILGESNLRRKELAVDGDTGTCADVSLQDGQIGILVSGPNCPEPPTDNATYRISVIGKGNQCDNPLFLAAYQEESQEARERTYVTCALDSTEYNDVHQTCSHTCVTSSTKVMLQWNQAVWWHAEDLFKICEISIEQMTEHLT